jgi:hypothetical protein
MGILALTADERVADVKFTTDSLSVALRDGRTITVPLMVPSFVQRHRG